MLPSQEVSECRGLAQTISKLERDPEAKADVIIKQERASKWVSDIPPRTGHR